MRITHNSRESGSRPSPPRGTRLPYSLDRRVLAILFKTPVIDELLLEIDRIVEYRTILSARILYLLVSFESEATVEEIKQLIFEHDGQTPPSEWLVDLVDLFRAEEADVDSLLPVIQDAWNYFPHRSLGGRCPAEVMVDLAQPRHARRGRP